MKPSRRGGLRLAKLKPFSLFGNAKRAKEILTTLAKYGFADVINLLDAPPLWLRQLVVPKELQKLNTWQRIRRACEDLGPTFVKLGQILSTRGDVLPADLIEELKDLQNQVRPEKWENIESVFLEELDGPVEEHFSEFNQSPIAAGSIGQIHFARLRESGDPVAVKIQRPDILDEILADLEIIAWFAQQMHQRIPRLRGYDIPTIVQETRKGILEEIDFSNEARNAQLFNMLNPDPENVFAPIVYDQFTTSRLTVTEWVDGKRPGDMELSPAEGRRIAKIAGASVLHQIVIAGFFHADPHAGNIVITLDHRVCFLDWGVAGQLTRKMRYFLADFFSALASNDPERVVRVAVSNNQSNQLLDIQQMEKDVIHAMRKYEQFISTGTGFGRTGLELLYVLGSNGLSLARDYSLLSKALVAVESTGQALDPAFDIRDIANPYIERLRWERWHPNRIAKDGVQGLYETICRLQELPGDLQRTLRRVETGDLMLRLNVKGLEEMNNFLSLASNRVSVAVIVGAIIMGSSIIVSTDSPPTLFGINLGMVGFVLSALLGFWIVWDIIRHGRYR